MLQKSQRSGSFGATFDGVRRSGLDRVKAKVKLGQQPGKGAAGMTNRGNRAIFMTLLVALTTCLVGCTTTKIYNVEAAPLVTASTTTSDEIAQAIREAAQRQGWVMNDVKPGEMRGLFSRGRHIAVVSVRYDRSRFSVEYLDSANLKHHGGQIHKVYNCGSSSWKSRSNKRSASCRKIQMSCPSRRVAVEDGRTLTERFLRLTGTHRAQ